LRIPVATVPAEAGAPAVAPVPASAPQFTPPRITVDVLLQMLRDTNVADREWAAKELSILRAKDHPNVVQALQSAAKDPEPCVRLAALRAVVAMKAEPQQIYAAATPLLQDPDSQIRTEAYQDLRRIGVMR
jgi:HEAT repeat protein